MELLYLLIIFVLSCFIGFYVIWNVTPALHSPLMAITNAISSIIILGAIIASSIDDINLSSMLGFAGLILAFINIFGGFVITYRMIKMFKKKNKK